MTTRGNHGCHNTMTPPPSCHKQLLVGWKLVVLMMEREQDSNSNRGDGSHIMTPLPMFFMGAFFWDCCPVPIAFAGEVLVFLIYIIYNCVVPSLMREVYF
jgi:hypothetical protein